MRRTLPLTISFVAGFLMIIQAIFVSKGYNTLIQTYLVRSVTVSTAWAVALGAMNLMRVHWAKISRKREGWQNSLVLYVCFWGLLLLGLFTAKGNQDPLYLYFYNNMNVPLSATMFSVLCFYIASAAYRAFRVRNAEATLLLGSAVLVMLGSVSIGDAMWVGFPVIKNWIMDQANTAVMRGLTIGITLGMLAQAMRNLLGIERGYMSGE